MLHERKFYRCKHCGNIISFVEDKGVSITCCGEEMGKIVPNSSDGASEKHVPIGMRVGDILKVAIGEILHPSLTEHHISWIEIATKGCTTRVQLNPSEEPTTDFHVGSEPVTIYAYCNLHGLWTADI